MQQAGPPILALAELPKPADTLTGRSDGPRQRVSSHIPLKKTTPHSLLGTLLCDGYRSSRRQQGVFML